MCMTILSAYCLNYTNLLKMVQDVFLYSNEPISIWYTLHTTHHATRCYSLKLKFSHKLNQAGSLYFRFIQFWSWSSFRRYKITLKCPWFYFCAHATLNLVEGFACVVVVMFGSELPRIVVILLFKRCSTKKFLWIWRGFNLKFWLQCVKVLIHKAAKI